MKMKILFLFMVLSLGIAGTMHTFSDENTDILVNQINPQRVSIEINIGEVEMDIKRYGENLFTNISLDDGYSTKELGAPSLPQINRLLQMT